MNERIEQLEVKVAFLEQANSQLSDELFRLRRELEALGTKLHTLAGRFEAALVPPTAYSAEDEKPPHY
jgi:SlyX protein